jgi:hypothetical protein
MCLGNQTINVRAGDMTLVVECQPSKEKALSSNFSTTKEKKSLPRIRRLIINCKAYMKMGKGTNLRGQGLFSNFISFKILGALTPPVEMCSHMNNS